MDFTGTHMPIGDIDPLTGRLLFLVGFVDALQHMAEDGDVPDVPDPRSFVHAWQMMLGALLALAAAQDRLDPDVAMLYTLLQERSHKPW